MRPSRVSVRSRSQVTRFSRAWVAWIIATLGLAGAISTGTLAQVPPAPPGAAVETVTVEDVQTRRQQAEQLTDLDDATKQKVLQTYDQALGMLDAAAQSAARVAELEARIASAQDQIKAHGKQLAELQSASPDLPSGAEQLQDVRRVRAEKEEALSKEKETLSALSTEAARRISGRKEIPGLVTAAREQLAKLEQELLVPASPDTPAALMLAQRTFLLAQREAIKQSIAAYEKELASYDATADLSPLQQRVTAARVALLEEEVRKWRDAENRLLEQAARRQADRARLEAIRADPALESIAEVNRDLAELGETMAQLTRTESEKLEAVKTTLEEITNQFERIEGRVERIGLTNAIGLQMRTRRAALPDLFDHRREVRARQVQMRGVQAKLFELEDQRTEGLNLERQVQLALADLRSAPTAIPPADLEAAVRDYLGKRSQYLDAAIRRHYDALKALGELDDTQRQLISEVEEFATYIDKRVLWIRSADVLSPSDLRLAAGILRSGSSRLGWIAWADLWQAVAADAQQRAWLVGLAVAVFGAWIAVQRRLRTWLARRGKTATQSTQHQILPTLEALLLTVLIAAVWPTLLGYLAWRILSISESTDFARAVGLGLTRVAGWWLPLELLRQLCRPNGVADVHFDWPAGSLRVLRRHLRWYVLAGLPLVFLVALMDGQGIERWQHSLGRLSFIATMLLMVLLVQCTLRPSGSLFRHLLAEARGSWFYRSRHVCYWLGILAPVGIVIAAAVGYLYTAHQLAGRLRETVFLLLTLTVLGAVLSRWVLVVRRRLAIDRARRRRAATPQSGAASVETPAIGGLAAPASELEPDLTTVSAQTRRLLNSALLLTGIVGIWWIWAQVLPALAILDEVELWSTTVRARESITALDGTKAFTTVERPDVITLADLGVAILIFLMTFIAARNVAGLLEIFLSRLPPRLALDAGARYAITTSARYLLIAVGIVLGFGAIGIGWSKVQWLVAALGVGLGFGLQEIFANFVSGLMILFERPIRVGDVVTIADVTGVVTRIQIRATTVTNWDRKEFIVPNKEFVTGRLLNWTRADQINRVVINVGIAYGSDTERARELLESIARSHPEVMDDPAPLITFEEFGESSLNFVVRCYLPTMDKRLQTIHELHTSIDQAFREAGIEIAFPQRDIHLRP